MKRKAIGGGQWRRVGETRYNRIMSTFERAMTVAVAPYDGNKKGQILYARMAEFCRNTIANFHEEFSNLTDDISDSE